MLPELHLMLLIKRLFIVLLLLVAFEVTQFAQLQHLYSTDHLTVERDCQWCQHTGSTAALPPSNTSFLAAIFELTTVPLFSETYLIVSFQRYLRPQQNAPPLIR